MSQRYANELRADTTVIIVPIITVVAMAYASLQAMVGDLLGPRWPYGVLLVGSTFVGFRTRSLVASERPFPAARLFLTSYVVMLALIIFHEWESGSMLPYFYGVFVVVGAMMVGPLAGFSVWFGSSVLLVAVTAVSQGWSLALISDLLGPILVNLLLATAAYLSALEWQFAVESVSELHRKVQRRRDELFLIQEDLRDANLRLKSANEQLEEARATAVNERDLRTRFMNNVSHELRTPLNAIVNFAHILSRGARGPVNDAQLDYLHRIEQSGFHLLTVLNDLLDMAQIEAGEFKLRMETADLQPLCEEAMINVRGLVMDKDVRLVRDYPDEWPLVFVDKIRFKQALINLLGNAAKYTESGHIALRVHPTEKEVAIIVEDSGIGIDPRYHEEVFQEFRQIDEAPARRRAGTGLGLPITRHLIRRHGGEVRVESELGKGSRFIMTLPVALPGGGVHNGRIATTDSSQPAIDA